MVKFEVDPAVAFFSLQTEGFRRLKTFRRVFRRQRRWCDGNIVISKLASSETNSTTTLSGCKFRQEKHSPCISQTTFFAGTIFFAGASLAGSSFRRSDLSCCPQRHQLAFSKREAKSNGKPLVYTVSLLLQNRSSIPITIALACFHPPT